jgi:signal transduction histidine kinase
VSDRTDLDLVPARWSGLSNVLSLFGLALLAWGASSEVVHLVSGVGRPVAFGLLAIAGVSWIVALVLRRDNSPISLAAIGLMALTGGALVAFGAIAMVFPAVAVMSATVRWRIPVAAAVAAAGWLAMFVAEVATKASLGVILGCLAAILAGALIGISRRQAVEQTALAARTELERARMEVERERAQLLSERNHMAREIHDVLAHTLAALSLQLEAFGTVVDGEPGTTPAVRQQLERTRRLVHEGLEEARGAVRALRDDPLPLEDQLQKLCAQHDADLTVTGRPTPLSPEVAISLYRVAQEALTNVLKHATRAATSGGLSYGEQNLSISIENAGAQGFSALKDSGGGYGLQGIAERLALLGGHMEAGPIPKGWRVTATVPLAALPAARENSAAR